MFPTDAEHNDEDDENGHPCDSFVPKNMEQKFRFDATLYDV